jgi:hypothetical protein
MKIESTHPKPLAELSGLIASHYYQPKHVGMFRTCVLTLLEEILELLKNNKAR